MNRFLPALMILFLLSACGSSASTTPTPDLPTLIAPSPVPPTLAQVTLVSPPAAESEAIAATPVCISSQPAQADIDRALGFTGKLFERLDWKRSYMVADGHVSVTWSSGALASIAFLEALIFPCGYEELDLDQYFSGENWQVIFGDYQSYEAVSECRTDQGLRLYEFQAVDQGREYGIRYWAVNDTNTRVIVMMTVFPVEKPALADEYAYSLFPQLITCP